MRTLSVIKVFFIMLDFMDAHSLSMELRPFGNDLISPEQPTNKRYNRKTKEYLRSAINIRHDNIKQR